MTRRVVRLSEEQVLHIVKSRGDFSINPYARNQRHVLKVVEAMRKRGALTRRKAHSDYWIYELPEANDGHA